MRNRKRLIILLIAIVHMALVFLFLHIGVSLSGFESSGSMGGRIGDGFFLLAIVMMFPLALLRYLHIPTIADLPLWEGSARDYFGGLLDLPLIFLNSLLWAIVVYELWTRVRARGRPATRS